MLHNKLNALPNLSLQFETTHQNLISFPKNILTLDAHSFSGLQQYQYESRTELILVQTSQLSISTAITILRSLIDILNLSLLFFNTKQLHSFVLHLT